MNLSINTRGSQPTYSGWPRRGFRAFYSLQRPDTYARWSAEVPPGFVFAVKGGRFVTHMKKLRGVRGPLANFFASGVLRLGEVV